MAFTIASASKAMAASSSTNRLQGLVASRGGMVGPSRRAAIASTTRGTITTHSVVASSTLPDKGPITSQITTTRIPTSSSSTNTREVATSRGMIVTRTSATTSKGLSASMTTVPTTATPTVNVATTETPMASANKQETRGLLIFLSSTQLRKVTIDID